MDYPTELELLWEEIHEFNNQIRHARIWVEVEQDDDWDLETEAEQYVFDVQHIAGDCIYTTHSRTHMAAFVAGYLKCFNRQKEGES